MKKLFVMTMITTVAILLVSASAFAASEAISITATVSGVQGVSLSGASWAVGAIDAGASSSSSTITATNTGSGPETLQMSAVSTGDFTLDATADVDQIAIWGKCAATDPGLVEVNALTGTPGQTSAIVNAGSGLTVYMEYHAPSSVSGGNSDGAATVTVGTAAP